MRIKVVHVDVLHAVIVKWIKGKFYELTKGDRFEMWSNERTGEHFLKFRQPKQGDSGVYKVKVQSQNGEEECCFEVKVGRRFSAIAFARNISKQKNSTLRLRAQCFDAIAWNAFAETTGTLMLSQSFVT